MTGGTIFWAVFLALLSAMAVGFFCWCLVMLPHTWGADDIRAVCERHQGVEQIDAAVWQSPAPAKDVTVVCRDGWVGQVQP